MKKVTLFFLILFFVIISGVFALSIIYPNNIQVPTNLKLTVSEVAQHHTADDCYLIIKNKIYNVSALADIHPGGRQNIIDNCGQEVTDLFASIHANNVWDLLGQYYIGDIIVR